MPPSWHRKRNMTHRSSGILCWRQVGRCPFFLNDVLLSSCGGPSHGEGRGPLPPPRGKTAMTGLCIGQRYMKYWRASSFQKKSGARKRYQKCDDLMTFVSAEGELFKKKKWCQEAIPIKCDDLMTFFSAEGGAGSGRRERKTDPQEQFRKEKHDPPVFWDFMMASGGPLPCFFLTGVLLFSCGVQATGRAGVRCPPPEEKLP